VNMVISTLVESKNVENENEGEGTNVRVWVRAVPTFIKYHFQHFYFSTVV
jgi:hypothetical protein